MSRRSSSPSPRSELAPEPEAPSAESTFTLGWLLLQVVLCIIMVLCFFVGGAFALRIEYMLRDGAEFLSWEVLRFLVGGFFLVTIPALLFTWSLRLPRWDFWVTLLIQSGIFSVLVVTSFLRS